MNFCLPRSAFSMNNSAQQYILHVYIYVTVLGLEGCVFSALSINSSAFSINSSAFRPFDQQFRIPHVDQQFRILHVVFWEFSCFPHVRSIVPHSARHRGWKNSTLSWVPHPHSFRMHDEQFRVPHVNNYLRILSGISAFRTSITMQYVLRPHSACSMSSSAFRITPMPTLGHRLIEISVFHVSHVNNCITRLGGIAVFRMFYEHFRLPPMLSQDWEVPHHFELRIPHVQWAVPRSARQ